MDGFAWVQQADFSGGAYPSQERLPRNGVEDCINGFYDDDGSVVKRGGGAYKSAAAGDTVRGVLDVVLGGGQRTIGLTAHSVLQLAADDTAWETVLSDAALITYPVRPAVVNGVLAVPIVLAGVSKILLHGGSRTGSTSASAADVTVAQGDTGLSGGAGANWLADVDPGTLLTAPGPGVSVVRSVESNNAATLATPWQGTSLAAEAAYGLASMAFVDPGGYGMPSPPASYRQFVAAVANRLLVGQINEITFSLPLMPDRFQADQGDYHVLPDGAVLTGIQALGTSALIFTTQGVYRIDNLTYDLTDALGNVQQQMSVEGHDVILWGDAGIAGIDGGVLVPAIDGLYVQSGPRLERMNAASGMLKLWRSYVAAGYTLGMAAAYRGHYFLPILNGTTPVDLLVLRLDTGAWSRWSGHSAGVSFARRAATSSAPPKLLAASGTRLLDLTATLAPSAGNKVEADGSQHNLVLTPRTVRRRDGVPETLVKMRVRYELDDAATDNPTLVAAVAVGRPSSTFTGLSGSAPESDGQVPKTWGKINRRGTQARVRLSSVGPSSSLVVRSVETAWRPSGRQ